VLVDVVEHGATVAAPSAGAGSVASVTPEELDRLLVPAAARLPSNAAYLEHLARAAADPGLVRLASNESTEPPSPRVREALARAADDAHLYPPPVPPLRRTLAGRNGLPLDRVLLGAGSTELIDALFRAVVSPGGEVVLPAPSWPVYRRRLTALDARLVEVPLVAGERAWAYDLDALLGALTPRTKLVVLCTPNNPTGNALAVDDVRRVADAAPLVLLDAAYGDFDAENDLSPLVHERANVVLARTFSKAYCLAGLRVGYILGDTAVLDAVDRFLLPGSSVASASLHAASAALEDEEHRARRVARVRAERVRLAEGLRERGVRAFDSRANFVAIETDDADALAARLLERGVLVRPLGRLVRITVGRPAENDAVLAAVADLRRPG
jgi:histidinol-phosphate aminotransferase